jgi:hypothetical protein
MIIILFWGEELDADRNMISCSLGQKRVLHDVAMVLGIRFYFPVSLQGYLLYTSSPTFSRYQNHNQYALAMHVHF